jgi:hypothetical protein
VSVVWQACDCVGVKAPLSLRPKATGAGGGGEGGYRL